MKSITNKNILDQTYNFINCRFDYIEDIKLYCMGDGKNKNEYILIDDGTGNNWELICRGFFEFEVTSMEMIKVIIEGFEGEKIYKES